MARPTTIRSKQVGNKLAMVTSVLNPFSVWFQLYDTEWTGKENGPFFLIREDEFEAELEATAMFEAWVKESELLVAAGD